MTNILLDTNAALWLLEDSSDLGLESRELIGAAAIWVSAVSLWEVAIKMRLGKLSSKRDFAEGLREAGIGELKASWRHAEDYGHVGLPHRDPFDHMLVAQARDEGMLFLTADRVILAANLPFVRDARA